MAKIGATRQRGRTARRWLATAAVVAAGLWAAATVAETATPAALRAAIDAAHPGVEWVSTATLATWTTAAAPRPILLDVREPAEFAVSHIRGARLVAPATTNVAALGLPRDATLVVYCSVGYRSAALAERLEAAGHRRVFNLDGGIFRWANEGRPLHRGDTVVTRVHPFDREWGRLLLARYRAAID
jgi:rhodanese-related sulfurtransferase